MTLPTDEEVTAALAAIAAYMEPEAEDPLLEAPIGWRAAIKLAPYEQVTTPLARRPTWGTIERLRRG